MQANNNSQQLYRHQGMQNVQTNGGSPPGSNVTGQQNLPVASGLQDVAGAAGHSPHSASGIPPHGASGISHHGASGLHHLTGASSLHQFAGAAGYPLAGPSSHHAVPAHSSHYPGATGHHGNPGSSGYHGHGASASHMHPAHQGHAGHSGHPALHPWYQTYQAAQMQNVANPYCMQDEQFNMWQPHPAMFPNDYVDFLGHNLFQMTPAVSHQHQHYDQHLDDLSRLPSPTITMSPSDNSSPGLENMTPTTPPNINNVSNHPNHHQGAHGITCGGGNSRNGGRPSAARSPYEWIKKTSYQSQPNPGKTRTKDKYRIVYTDTQRIELEKEFTFNNKYITIRRKTELAISLGLSERQIKIWFQNRRAKERKQMKKRQEERNAMQTRRLARNFTTYPGLMDSLEDPQLVNNPLPSGTRQHQQHGQATPVNITTSGGLLTPPSGSQDVLQPGCSYTQDPNQLPPHMKDDPEDHGTTG